MSAAQHQECFAALPNNVSLCYSRHGDTSAPAIVMVAGLSVQLVYWPAALIDALVEGGYQVICFDNRDCGRSSRFDTPFPTQYQQFRGKAPEGSYGLEQMAEDTALLLDHLKIDRAHFIGMSMGGMIAQVMAYQYPERVLSLVSIFSTTGNRKVGQPAYSTIWHMLRGKAPTSEQEAIENYRAFMRQIGDASQTDAEVHWQNYAVAAWQRNGSKADIRSRFRQIGAIMKSGDRTARLQTISVPSLVIHGDRDTMVHPSGGVATARAIPNAKHALIRGMRHQIDAAQSPGLAALCLQHINTTEVR